MTFGRLVILIVLAWTFIYTASFGVWTWKNKNRLGAVMVFIIAIASIALPIYSLYFREG